MSLGTLTIGQVAERAQVSIDTVRQWADAGKLRHTKTLGGHRRFFEDDVQQAIREMQDGGLTAKPAGDRGVA
jgi:excisionase family DNA binding protein